MSYSKWTSSDFGNNQLLEIIDGDRGKNYPNGEDFQNAGYCIFLNTKNVTKTGFDFTEKMFITKEKDEVLRKGKLIGYDVVMTTRGTVGNIAYFDPNIKYKNVRINSGMVIIRANNLFLQPKFLYYILKNPITQEKIKQFSTGSAQPQLPISTIKKVDFSLPDLATQKAIANILSSLDDKIELNNKINKNLEELAQTLYKRWFVDFEFPNEYGEPYKSSGGEMVESELGLIPKAWTIKEQGEYFPVITGKKNANIATSDGKYKFFTCSQEVYLTDSYSFEGDAILVAGNGDFNVKYYSGKFEAYQRTYVLIPQNNKLSGILYFAIQHNLNDITSGSRGSVISFITKGHIENFKVVFPNTTKLEELGIIFRNILISIAHNNEENDRLSKLRDELLPKLMNGEIEVPIEE